MKEEYSISNLIKIGLKESEAKIYINLLKKKNFTASEISKLTGISRPKTYEYLHRLVEKGLCTEILGSVKKYAPTNPETAFSGLRQKLKFEFENNNILLSSLSEALIPLYHSQKEMIDPLDYIQVIREKNSIIKKFESLEEIATMEVLALVKGPLAMDITKPHNLVEFNSLDQGVCYRTIYDIKDLRDVNLMNSIELFKNAGEDVKIAEELPIPFKMYLFDERIVMFILEDKIPSGSKLTALIVEHLDLVMGLKAIFNIYWQSSITLEEFKKGKNQ
ncbi:MAG TPA: TrmB family transcriptional regulator [Candidatus Cloacimonetes bacterium]|nr:TrmB family transcriptional regulator [Candidatus Cloacimonadota bacterium]